jgi:hypothetical protein
MASGFQSGAKFDRHLMRVIGENCRLSVELARDKAEMAQQSELARRHVFAALWESPDSADNCCEFVIAEARKRRRRHDDERSAIDTDALADGACELLIARPSSYQSDVRRVDLRDIPFIEKEIAAQAVAMAVEATEHPHLPGRVGYL